MKTETWDIIKKAHKQNGGISFHKSSAPVYLPIFAKLENSLSILDVGCGRGTLAKVLHSEFSGKFTIDGLEGYEGYIYPEMFEYYGRIILSDLVKFYTEKSFLDYDIYCFMDILEHLKKEDAVEIIRYLRNANKTIIVSIPINEKHYKQDNEYIKNNELERHLHDWNIREIENDLHLNLVDINGGLGVFANT